MSTNLINPNPQVHHSAGSQSVRQKTIEDDSDDDSYKQPFDSQEIFDLISNINDPEHPYTLAQLNVAQLEQINVDDLKSLVTVDFTPTIPHCSMATLIGLCIRVRLLRSLPDRFKVDIKVKEGSHESEAAGTLHASIVFNMISL